MSERLTRRMILRHGVKGSLGAVFTLGLSSCGAGDSNRVACSDPAAISRGEASMRNSLDYTDSSPHPDMSCQGCAYFSANEPGDSCGRCAILGGQVSNRGYCGSWSQRS